VSAVDRGEETGRMILIQDIAVVCNPFCEINAIGWVPGAAHNHQLDTLQGPGSEHRAVAKGDRTGFKRLWLNRLVRNGGRDLHGSRP
jgi:hypothetical protein